MTEFKAVKRNLEKILEAKAKAITVPDGCGWTAGTVINGDNITVYILKRKDTTYYYATIGGTPISWHNNTAGPETWVGENYSVEKAKDEMRSSLHTALDGVCHLGHFAPECLEDALRTFR